MGFAKFLTEDETADFCTVLAFDPGGHTGWCALTVRPSTLAIGGDDIALHASIVEAQYGQIDCGVGGVGHDLGVGRGHGDVNYLGEAEGVSQMIDLATEHWPNAAVVLEEFTLEMQDKGGDLLYPVRIMSSFSSQLISMGQHPEQRIAATERIFISRRADAKGNATDTRLRHWGLFDQHSGLHARDATRHAYHFLRKCRGGSIDAREKRWRAWPGIFGDPGRKTKQKRVEKQGERITFA